MKLLRRHDEDPPKQEADATECPHMTLVARWDSADDIGHEDRASSFRCEACGREFTLDEATHLRATEAQRLRERIAS